MYYVNNCKKAKTSNQWSSIINKKLPMYIVKLMRHHQFSASKNDNIAHLHTSIIQQTVET